jgi:hypothetical protein
MLQAGCVDRALGITLSCMEEGPAAASSLGFVSLATLPGLQFEISQGRMLIGSDQAMWLCPESSPRAGVT